MCCSSKSYFPLKIVLTVWQHNFSENVQKAGVGNGLGRSGCFGNGGFIVLSLAPLRFVSKCPCQDTEPLSALDEQVGTLLGFLRCQCVRM